MSFFPLKCCKKVKKLKWSVIILKPFTLKWMWSEMTLNYRMMVERYPNLKEKIGGPNPGLWNLLSTWRKTYQVINCFLCFNAGLPACCQNKKKTKNMEMHMRTSNLNTAWSPYYSRPWHQAYIIWFLQTRITEDAVLWSHNFYNLPT